MEISKIKAVAELRKELFLAKEVRDRLYEAFQNEHIKEFESVTTIGAELANAESAVRAEAIEEYKLCPSNKTPGPGITIKIFNVLEYEPGKALTWAIEHSLCLKLDVTSFEKLIKSGVFPYVDFVKVTEEARAQIATDLSKALQDIRFLESCEEK